MVGAVASAVTCCGTSGVPGSTVTSQVQTAVGSSALVTVMTAVPSLLPRTSTVRKLDTVPSGTGVSVEAKVKTGPITNLNCTQTIDGKLKFIITEAESTDGPIMTIGNTQTPVKFNKSPDEYMDEWFAEAPTHHFAMGVGHNGRLLEKVANLLEIPQVTLNK